MASEYARRGYQPPSDPGRKVTEGYKRYLKAGSERSGKFTASETGARGMAKAKHITDMAERIKELLRQKSDRYLGRIT